MTGRRQLAVLVAYAVPALVVLALSNALLPPAGFVALFAALDLGALYVGLSVVEGWRWPRELLRRD